MGDDAQPVDVIGDIECDGVHIQPAYPLQPDKVHHLHEHQALIAGEGAVQIPLDEGLGSAEAHRGGQHLGVADGGARIGEGACVLVDAEGEDGRREAGDLHLALTQKVEHRGSLGPVLGYHPVLALDEAGGLWPLGFVMVEHDHLHPRLAAQLSQITDAVGVGRVDDDKLADLALIEQAEVDDGQVLAVQRDELADIGGERAREHDAAFRIEQRCPHGRGQRVEIGVLVGRDDRLGFKQ